MIFSISDNNTHLISEALKKGRFRAVVSADFARHTEGFLDYILVPENGIETVLCLTEAKPNMRFLEKFESLTIEEKNWSISDYITFLTALNRVSFENHAPVYEEDVSRLQAWRRIYAMGPFWRVSRKLHGLIKCSCVQKFIDAPLYVLGFALQIALPPLRKKKGTITGRYKNATIVISYFGDPEKDHYGESPFTAEKLQIFENFVTQNKHAAIFLTAGPRQDYLARLFDLEDGGKAQGFTAFAACLYRPKAYKITERRKAGLFSQGSNVSIDKKPVYSEHCLAIGAGERDLWYYASPSKE